MDDLLTSDEMGFVGEIHEQTDTTTERVKVLCLLAESLDMDEVKSKKADADTAFNYPSIADIDRETADRAMQRLAAVIEFRDALDAVDG